MSRDRKIKKIFRYDYNYQKFTTSLVISLVLASLGIVSYFFSDKIVGLVILLVMSVVAVFNAFFIIGMQGIRVNKKQQVVIFDKLLIRRLNIQNIKYVSVSQIPKENKSVTYGIFHEFFWPNTYIYHCDYVYNQGKVFDINFYMKDGTIETTYFGWLYKSKAKQVQKVEKRLNEFVKTINALCAR